jgi:hypothetical protein
MADRYKTSNDIFTFTSPSLSVIDKNLFYLLRNSEEKDFDRKYTFRPDYLSYDEYGTVALAWLLMYVNTVPSIEEFDLVTVVVPTYSAIIETLKDKFPTKEVDELIEVDW